MAETLIELVARISTDVTALKKGLSDAEGAAQKTSKSIQQSFKDVGTSMNNVGKQMSMKITAPIVGLGTAAFKMSGDFDQAFRKTNVMLGASAEEAINYKKRILEIASATSKSATDVADAFYQIVSAGYRGTDSLDILEIAMKGAVGGAAETESTMAALTKAMNIFGMEGVDGATKAMDIFFGIVDTGLLSFEQMASAFPQAASSAAGLGVSIEEVGAALGTLSKVTGSTDDAATALNNTFMQLIKPSDKMLELYNEWGVKSGPEAIEKFGGLSGVLSKVAEATGGNVDELAELFPSIRALKAVLPLVTTNADDYAAALDTVTNSQGNTSDAFDEMSEGSGFKLQQAITRIANTSIILGDTLEKYIVPALDFVTKKVEGLIEWWKSLDEIWRKVIITVVGILAAIGPMLIVFGQMAIGISGLIGLFKTLKIVQGLVTAAQWLWNIAMSANPIGIIIIAIAALVAAGIWLWKNWDKVVDFLKGLWINMKEIFAEGVKFIINTVLLPFVEIVTKEIGIVAKVVGKIAGLFNKDLGEAIEGFADKMLNARREITKWADDLAEGARVEKAIRETEKATQDVGEALTDTTEIVRENTDATKEQTDAAKENIDALKEQQDELISLTDKLRNLRREYEYTRSDAGRLGITIKDITFVLFDQGKSIDEISATLLKLGNNADDVNKVLDAFGLTAQEVNDILNQQKDSIDDVTKSLKNQADAVATLAAQQAKAAKAAGYSGSGAGFGGGEVESGMSPYQVAYQKGYDFENLTSSQYNEIADITGIQQFASGGKVSGAIGQPQFALVHGGETVIPANESMGNVIINMPNQPIILQREDQLYQLGDIISRALDRKYRLGGRI